MDVLIRLLIRALMSALSESKGGSTPVGTSRRGGRPDVESQWASVKQGASRARERFAELQASLDAVAFAPLREPVAAATAEAERLLERAESAAAEQAPGDPRPARRQLEAVNRRASALELVARQRSAPATGDLLSTADGLVAGLGAPIENAVVVLHDDPERLQRDLAGSGLAPLALPTIARDRTEPWPDLAGAAWSAALLARPGLQREATDRLEADQHDDGALDRLAADVVAGWAPALLLEAATVLALGSAAVIRAERADAAFDDTERRTVHVDGDGRVGAEPPPALRAAFRRTLAQALDLRLPPPPPSGPTRSAAGPAGRLLARGPGVLEWLPLEPFERRVREAVQPLVFGPLAALDDRDLASLDGLRDPSGVDAEAARLAAEVKAGREARPPDARTLLATLARLAVAGGLAAETRDRAFRMLEALGEMAPRRREAKRTSEAATARRRRDPTGERRRARGAVREALLLSAALSRPTSQG